LEIPKFSYKTSEKELPREEIGKLLIEEEETNEEF